MSSSINKNVNVERRTWDKETYEARARSRAAAEKDGGASRAAVSDAAASSGETNDAVTAIKNDIEPTEDKEEFLPAQQGRAGPMGSQRAFLKSRSRKVDLESKLGSTEIIDPAAASATKSNLAEDAATGAALTPASGVTKCSDGVGWHCRVCDCFLKDSLTYLDHINGRKHQRYLGYTMRVEKSTTEEVSGVLKGLADKKRERSNGLGIATSAAVDFEDVVRKKDEDALRRKAERARRREERKRKEKEEANGGGGGGSLQQSLNVVDEAETNSEEKGVTEGENPAEEEEEEEEEEPAIDPALAAMMGFSGFGGSRK